MTTFHMVASWKTMVIVGASLLAACGGGNGGADGGFIGPEGGMLTLPGGGRLVVPPGALAEPTRLQATSIAAPEGAGFTAVGPFHEFGPAGLSFARPAELVVPFDGTGVLADSLGMAWSADGTTWERLEATVDETTGEMRAEIQHFSKGGPGSWDQPLVCCLRPDGGTAEMTEAECVALKGEVLGGPELCRKVCCSVERPAGTEVSVISRAECDKIAYENPLIGVLADDDVDACAGCCADDWTKKKVSLCQHVSPFVQDCDPVCCQVGTAAPKVVAAGQCEAEGGKETGQPETCTVCCEDDWTVKPVGECAKPAADPELCEPTCCQVGAEEPQVLLGGDCQEMGGKVLGGPQDCEKVCCEDLTAGVVEVLTRADCDAVEAAHPDHVVSMDTPVEGCEACCADDWTVKHVDQCSVPGLAPEQCDPICCHQGDDIPVWMARGDCVGHLGTVGDEPASACGCTDDEECWLKDPTPNDCKTLRCVDLKCVEGPEGEGKSCDDGQKCTVLDECDGSGGCKGQPQVCDQPPGQKECYGGSCNPADGSCVYLLKAGVACGKDSDCPVNQMCTACQCHEACTQDLDCPDNDPNDCLVPQCGTGGICSLVHAAPGKSCDDHNDCTKDDQCIAGGTCQGTEVPPHLCPVCCGDDWTLKFAANCPLMVNSALCDKTCCDSGGEVQVMAVGACDQMGGTKTTDCQVCCATTWTATPFFVCPQVAESLDLCDPACCVKADLTFEVIPRGKCASQPNPPRYVIDPAGCADVCCTETAEGQTKVLLGPKFACEELGKIPGHTVVLSPAEGCAACCKDTWKVEPLADCQVPASDESQCVPVCCVDVDTSVGTVKPRGACTGFVLVLEDAASCYPVCCTIEYGGEISSGILTKAECEYLGQVPGAIMSETPADGTCLVCCPDDWTIKEAVVCQVQGASHKECDPVCCVTDGNARVLKRGECPDADETATPLDQCTKARLSTCTQPGQVFTGKTAVIQGPFPTATSTETAQGCPDIHHPDKYSNKTGGPDGTLAVQAPVDAYVVAAAYSKAWRVSTQVKPPCGQSGCKTSSWGNPRPEYPIYTSHYNDDYGKYGTNEVSPDQRIGERWAASVVKMLNSMPMPPLSPLTPFAPLAGDAPADTVDARVVFDSWQEPGQTIGGDFTAWYRVVDGPPVNDTAAGAIALVEGVPQAPETFLFASDDYQAAGCAAIPDGTGAGKPDLFYSFTPTASGVHRLEIGLITEDPPSDAFFAVLDPSGACVASGRGGAPFRSPVSLTAGTTYTIVLDAGSLSENAVHFVLVDRHNIPGDAAHQAPLNYSCGSAQAIGNLPFSAEVELSTGFNHVWPQSLCWAIMDWWFLAGDRDLLWSYTPPTDQYVRFKVTSLSEGFQPALLLLEACGSEWLATECLDAVRVPSGETTTSFVRKLTAGKTYFIAAEGGSDAPSAVRIELEAVAKNPDPDDCSNPLVLTELPAVVTLNARNLDDDVAGSGTLPAEGFCCGPTPCAPVGQGLADAVLAYTATESGVLDVLGLGTLYATTDACPSGVIDACTSLSRSATSVSVRLDAGQTAYVVVDGWESGWWFQEVTVEASCLPRPTNEACDSARAVTALPWEETATLAFTANDVTALNQGCSEVVNYLGDYTSGGDLVWRYDPGATSKDVIVGMLSADFSNYNEPSMYVLGSCGAMPTGDCWDGFVYQSGSYRGNHVVLWGVDAPVFIVVDHQAQDVPGAFTWMAQEVTPPPNDTCATAIPVTTLPFRHVANNVLATNDYSLASGNACESFGSPLGFGPDVVYRLDITADLLAAYSVIQVDATACSFGVSLMAFRNGCDPATNCVTAMAHSYLWVPLDGFVAGDVLYLVVDGTTNNSSKNAGMYVIEIGGI